MDEEPAAEASVNSEMQDQIKHERGAMRNMLLTMVHDPQGRPITHPVPTLTNLIIDRAIESAGPYTYCLPANSDHITLCSAGSGQCQPAMGFGG
ncbi:hypothetical protein PtA15_11A260 [Puccinia triticina]|uniref:Uncharacterized protein n=1 Tax=Puccinia triticina TaxID=208348 RepID=A0ABY7D0M7_9BASI|nr:uncharacterized protein PtA15_11A260 [Puccinia triticina]WAQ89570.1 hypothetical protein PtA15_11A260 [Puccinia triticina]